MNHSGADGDCQYHSGPGQEVAPQLVKRWLAHGQAASSSAQCRSTTSLWKA